VRGSVSANMRAFNISFETRLCNTGMVYKSCNRQRESKSVGII